MSQYINPEIQRVSYKSDVERTLEMRLAHFKGRILELVQDLEVLAKYDETVTFEKNKYLGHMRAKVRRYVGRQLLERVTKIEAEMEKIVYKS